LARAESIELASKRARLIRLPALLSLPPSKPWIMRTFQMLCSEKLTSYLKLAQGGEKRQSVGFSPVFEYFYLAFSANLVKLAYGLNF
jgi:hypothetical protein